MMPVYGMDTAGTRHEHGRDTDFTYIKSEVADDMLPIL